jgi:hypothetical protein
MTSYTPTKIRKNSQKNELLKPSLLTFFCIPHIFTNPPRSHMACKYVILPGVTRLGVAPHVEGDVIKMKG